MSAFDLTGKVAIVTGAASGIGEASVRLLKQAGATVLGADVARGADALVDVTDRAQVDHLVDDVVEEHGRLDAMCNVAGIMIDAHIAEVTDEQLDRLFAVNLRGVLYGCQAAVRAMRASGATGSIVNMASGAIDQPMPGVGLYAMAKAAIAMMTRTLATEVGGAGIRVNAIAPGFVVTGMTSRWFTGDDGTIDEPRRDAVTAMMAKGAPLGRVGAPEDIAHAVWYLVSDASSWMTGQILRPNGGVTMPW